MSSVWLLADGQCCAGLDALVPRVIKLGVTYTSAVSEPRTIVTTTTYFTRSVDGSTFGACGTDCRRRDCGYVYVGIGQTK